MDRVLFLIMGWFLGSWGYSGIAEDKGIQKERKTWCDKYTDRVQHAECTEKGEGQPE